MSYYIYGFRVIGDTECRYIGMTSRQPEDRLYQREAQAAARARWGNPDPLQIWLHENKGKVEAFKIAKVETEAEARAMERTIIALSLRLGQRLFNRWLVPMELRIGWQPYVTARRLSAEMVAQYIAGEAEPGADAWRRAEAAWPELAEKLNGGGK